MIRCLYRDGKGGLSADLPVEQWAQALADPAGLLWVDLTDEPPERVEQLLSEQFGFHPLAIKSTLEDDSPPGLTDWGDHLYAVLHSLPAADHPDAPLAATARAGATLIDLVPEQLTTHEIDVFLGANFLVTYHKAAVVAPSHLWSVVEGHPENLTRGPAFLLYHVVDAVMSSYLRVLYQIDDALDALEVQIFEDTSNAPRSSCLALKRLLLELRQLVRPQREALAHLAHEPLGCVGDQARVYYQDALDDLLHIQDVINTLIERVDAVLGVYLSVVANRTNHVVRLLTVYTALFLPITFLATLFGVNFPYLPLQLPVWIAFLIVTVATPLALWIWFKRRGWV